LQEIDSALVLKTLLPIWSKTPETGSRLRGRLEPVFAWSLAHKLYAGTNPASLDVLRDALPAKPRAKHHAALPYAELPPFMQRLRDSSWAAWEVRAWPKPTKFRDCYGEKPRCGWTFAPRLQETRPARSRHLRS